ncbi:hypothetical protein HYW36_01385 [Candidatus Saccharibacteria bacterium]|nr:hypothetical protein [Candidatus Saccharibacteria bacterium]
MVSQRVRLVWFGLLAPAVLLFFVVAIGGLLVVAAKSQQLVDLKSRSKTADDQLASLAQAKKQVNQYAYFNDVAKTVLPSDKDQAQAVLDIIKLADLSGISIASITFPGSSLGSKPTSDSTSSKDAAATSGQNAISQAKPVEGIAGLYSLELNITPQSGSGLPDDRRATYPKFLDFLNRIEQNRRTAQITKVSVQPQATESGPSPFINFSITINIFMKP